MTYSELNKKEKWTKSEALKMMLYCLKTFKTMPSEKKINKAKIALQTSKYLYINKNYNINLLY